MGLEKNILEQLFKEHHRTNGRPDLMIIAKTSRSYSVSSHPLFHRIFNANVHILSHLP